MPVCDHHNPTNCSLKESCERRPHAVFYQHLDHPDRKIHYKKFKGEIVEENVNKCSYRVKCTDIAHSQYWRELYSIQHINEKTGEVVYPSMCYYGENCRYSQQCRELALAKKGKLKFRIYSEREVTRRNSPPEHE
jgi:hypothetical protein